MKAIVKAIVPADNFSYQKTHPTRSQIFANTVGRICKLNLTLRQMTILTSLLTLHLQSSMKNESQPTRAIISRNFRWRI